jgi:mono/diheme cytochrome c family protein
MNAAGKLVKGGILLLAIPAAFLFWRLGYSVGASADEGLTDPYMGQPDAIAEGDDIYHSKCIICHGLKGGRGPNLFATTLTDEQFLEVVINGRKGMPAWGLRLSPDDVWKIHAFIKAHPTGLTL